MQPELVTHAEQSAKAFEALQTSLAVSSALSRREQRRTFRKNLDRYLELAESLLKSGLWLVEHRGKIEEVADALERVEAIKAHLDLLVAIRAGALRKHRELAAYWTPAVDERYRAMIRTYEEGVATLRRYDSAIRRIQDTIIEARLKALDAVEAIGTEEEHRASWERLQRALDEDRPSGRKLFPE